MIERVNAPALGAGGLTLLKYTNKKSWYKLYQLKITYFIFFVGVAGFEPTTPCSQSSVIIKDIQLHISQL